MNPSPNPETQTTQPPEPLEWPGRIEVGKVIVYLKSRRVNPRSRNILPKVGLSDAIERYGCFWKNTPITRPFETRRPLIRPCALRWNCTRRNSRCRRTGLCPGDQPDVPVSRVLDHKVVVFDDDRVGRFQLFARIKPGIATQLVLAHGRCLFGVMIAGCSRRSVLAFPASGGAWRPCPAVAVLIFSGMCSDRIKFGDLHRLAHGDERCKVAQHDTPRSWSGK